MGKRGDFRHESKTKSPGIRQGFFADQEILVPFAQIMPHFFLYVNTF